MEGSKLTEYELILSRRKTIGLTVERDSRLVVRAPEGTTSAQVQAVLARKALWLYRQRRRPERYPEKPLRKEFVTGESLLYLGRHYRLEVVLEPSDEVSFHGKFQFETERNWEFGDGLDRNISFLFFLPAGSVSAKPFSRP